MEHQYDAIIVGAGGAGLYAALEASKHAKTAVVSKLYPIRSHTGTAQGGIGAALGNLEPDSPEWHAFDTIKGGDYLADQQAVKILVEGAVESVYDLEHQGLPFSRTADGKIDQRRFGGHTRNFGEAPVRRSCYAADRTGHMILQTLYQQCIKNNVTFYDEFYTLDAIFEGNKIAGITALDLKTGELIVMRAKAVLFATGGFGRMFRITSNAHANTGDGPAILARRGVPLEDLEFFQFHPTGIAGLGILITEGVRGEGGILRNRKGERFMEQYAPTLLDLAPRDMIARAMLTEIKKGNGMRGDSEIDDFLLLDATHLGADVIKKKLPDIAEFSRTYIGVDPATAPIPVQPTAHYAMGGIPTDTNGQVLADGKGSLYEGLYAAGECACVSVHGANRLGTNSLVDLVVYGKRAGREIAKYISQADFAPMQSNALDPIHETIERFKKNKKGRSAYELRDTMQKTMMELVGIFRTAKELDRAVGKLADLRESFAEVRVDDQGSSFNTNLMETLELENLLDLSYLTALSARNRTESRGAHSRDDYKDRDDAKWLKHTLVRMKDSRYEFDYREVDTSIMKPKPRAY